MGYISTGLAALSRHCVKGFPQPILRMVVLVMETHRVAVCVRHIRGGGRWVEPLHCNPHCFLDLDGPVFLVRTDGEMQAEETLADMMHLQPEGKLAIVIGGREADGFLLRIAVKRVVCRGLDSHGQL